MKKIILILLIILIVVVTNFPLRKKIVVPQVSVLEKREEICFKRISGGVYSSEEYVKLSFDDEQIYGTKFGTQTGPDMTNGYLGVLNGTKKGENLILDFSYTIEGSNNTERELYKISGKSLEKHRYPLREENDILLPDESGELNVQGYEEISCDEFSSKLPR